MPGPRKSSSEAGGTAYDRAARPVMELAGTLGDLSRPSDLPAVLGEARRRLDRFGEEVLRARMPPASVPPARLALALVLDQAARGNRDLPLRDWAAGAQRLLFDGEEMSAGRLRDFAARAERAGPAFAEVAAFLAACLARLDGARAGRAEEADGWGGLLLAAVLAYACLVLAWMLHAEWTFHQEAARAFAAEAVAIGLDRPGAMPDLAARLDRMAAAVGNAEATLARGPARLAAGPLGFDAVAKVRAVQAEAVARHLPPVLARGIDGALAAEGDSLALYDTLRAWDILSGEAPWNAGYLQGWLRDRADILPDLKGLVPHVPLLAGPSASLPPPDPELLAQARVFAAQAPEADRAWMELLRSPAMTALPPWRPDLAIPNLADVAVRQSGLPMDAPLPGAFTAQGWGVARDGGAEAAVATARAEARRMFPGGLPVATDSADRALERLQAETLDAWAALLDDLRVRPFTRRAVGVLVSGLLARRDSPLAQLLRAAWVEVGGTDRDRPQDLQLRIAATFGPTIQYVESGGLSDISTLFGSLNAVLGARDQGEELLTERLMGFSDRAASVAALRQAPPVVVRIVEDVLAQVGVSRERQLVNPFTRGWQAQVFDLCRRATEGRFPFDPEGADADLAEVAALLAPGGALDRFFREEAEPWIDASASPWRWRPEARFDGLSPESAALFERAAAVRAAFFGSGGTMGTEVTLAALAERGKAVVALGGASAAVEAATEAAVLTWPGPDPAAGVAVAFQPQGGSTLAQPGPWGFLRLLSGLRLRERDGGRRFLVDLRSEEGRIFLEMTFPSAANPVAGLRHAQGFSCPAAL